MVCTTILITNVRLRGESRRTDRSGCGTGRRAGADERVSRKRSLTAQSNAFRVRPDPATEPLPAALSWPRPRIQRSIAAVSASPVRRAAAPAGPRRRRRGAGRGGAGAAGPGGRGGAGASRAGLHHLIQAVSRGERKRNCGQRGASGPKPAIENCAESHQTPDYLPNIRGFISPMRHVALLCHQIHRLRLNRIRWTFRVYSTLPRC